MAKKDYKTNTPWGGIMISFEGAEGCGKSTQIQRLHTNLEDAGFKVVSTREPGGTDIGEEIRHLLKYSHENVRMFPETELLLFAAARAQLVREVILPQINKGRIVLCDRFMDSTTVYQGIARQVSDDPLQTINEFAIGDIMPDLTFILDVPEEVSMQRVQERHEGPPDRFEQESIDFYAKVRKGYLLLAESMPDRFYIIDGTLDRKLIEDEIYQSVRERFEL
jgi:dTMP kinase